MLTTLTLSLLLAPLAPQAAAPATAPQEKPAPTLKAGDAAPALAIETWLKGKPVTAFEPGHVYVVEFWRRGAARASRACRTSRRCKPTTRAR